MKFTLKQKRTFVKRFWSGESVYMIAATANEGRNYPGTDAIEYIIRDYMNGKFTMPKKKLEGK